MARKVLLADDSVAVQRAVEATLEPKDFEVLSVSRGSDVIPEAKKIHPDVILVDGDLTDLDGYEVCKRVKEDPELMHIPVIVMASQEDPERARAVGAEGEIAKPFRGEDLLEQVMAVVDLTLEPTVKIDTSEIEEFDLGEEPVEEELELGELELDEGVLELTEEMEGLQDTGEAVLEGLEEFELEKPEEEKPPRRSVKTEELEEISFEEEIDELDLGELELEGAEGVGALEEDLEVEGPKELMVTDEVELGVDLDEELSLEEGLEEELAETEAEGGEPLLDTKDLDMEASSPSLLDTDELETLGLEGEGEEEVLLEELGETSIDFDETMIAGPDEVAEETVRLEGASPSEDETALEWVEEEAKEEGIEEEGGLGVEEELVFEEPREEEAIAPRPSPTFEQVQEVAQVSPPAMGVIEEVSLEEELLEEAPLVGILELEEIPVQEIPSLEEFAPMELSEEDLGVVDPFSEEGIRRELARSLEEVVQRILSDMAPPIVEKVARDIALEQAERIILQEIERIKRDTDSL